MENSVSIRQGKTAWDSGQDKNRMQNQVIIIITITIYVHIKSEKHRKIEGKLPQQFLTLPGSPKVLLFPMDICIGCSQRHPLPPAAPHFHALLMEMARCSIQCLAKVTAHRAYYPITGWNSLYFINFILMHPCWVLFISLLLIKKFPED